MNVCWCVRFSFFTDWLGRTSLKWSVLCWVGHKTLTTSWVKEWWRWCSQAMEAVFIRCLLHAVIPLQYILQITVQKWPILHYRQYIHQGSYPDNSSVIWDEKCVEQNNTHSREFNRHCAVTTFCVSRRRRKMHCGHARLCVCLSVRGRTPTLLHGPGCNLRAW